MSLAPIGSSTSGIQRLASGTMVRVTKPGSVPLWSRWDDDRGRTSGPVKKRMMAMFFQGDPKLRAEIAWVVSESERDELFRKGRTKIKCKESSGTTLTFTADLANLKAIK